MIVPLQQHTGVPCLKPEGCCQSVVEATCEVSPGMWGLRSGNVISDLRGHEDLKETVALPPPKPG